jgi:hypothetical protein
VKDCGEGKERKREGEGEKERVAMETMRFVDEYCAER